MQKLNLLEILKNTIVEQTSPGMYDYDIYPEYQTIDVDTGVASIVSGVGGNKEELKKLDEFQTMGSCKGWKRAEKYGFKNGDPNATYLVALKNHPSVKLHSEAAKNFNDMEEFYHYETGKNFGSLGGFRTYESQWDIFDLDYCIKTGISKKIKTEGVPVAKPGTSNHGTGEAIDVGSQEEQDWIDRNGKLFGWCHGEAPEEPWHFTYDFIYCK